jgi:hypothetical protein
LDSPRSPKIYDKRRSNRLSNCFSKKPVWLERVECQLALSAARRLEESTRTALRRGGVDLVVGVGKLENSTAPATKQLALLVTGARHENRIAE